MGPPCPFKPECARHDAIVTRGWRMRRAGALLSVVEP